MGSDGDASGNEDGYWVCTGCPAAEECSEQAWKKAKKRWGYTLEECQSRVYLHLQTSGKQRELKKWQREHLVYDAEYEPIGGMGPAMDWNWVGSRRPPSRSAGRPLAAAQGCCRPLASSP